LGNNLRHFNGPDRHDQIPNNPDGYRPNNVPAALKLVQGHYKEVNDMDQSMAQLSSLHFDGKITLWQYVKNLDSAVAWYTEKLGLKYAHDIGLAYFLTINEYTELAISDLYMGESTEHSCPRSVMLDLHSQNIRETHQLLTERGVKVEALENPAATYYEFYFWDLEENKIRVSGFIR